MSCSPFFRLSLKLAISLIIFCFSIPGVGFAADVTLAWDKPTNSSPFTGYRIYYGKSGTNYKSAPIITVSADKTSTLVSSLEEGQIYGFAATTYDAAGNESAFSSDFFYSVPVSGIPGQIILDNGGVGTSSTGTWTISSGANYYGTSSLWGRTVGYTYTFQATISGTYEVSAWWTEQSSRGTNVPIQIYDGQNLLDTVYVNQLQDGGQWNLLGTYKFSGQGRIIVVSDSTIYSACADAVKLAPATVIDTDGDGLSDSDEINIYSTDSNQADTDGDGIGDGDEVANWGDNWQADVDGDGIINLLDPDSDNDGVLDGVEINQGTDPASGPGTGGIVLEMGEVKTDHRWTTVYLSKSFSNPIIIANPMSIKGGDPAVIRIRNVTESSFEIRVQEWDYLDGIHTEESVNYIVMEAGTHKLSDGSTIEAGKFNTNSALKSVSFKSSFRVTPVVLSGIGTYNDQDAVTGRISHVTTTEYKFRLQEQEANNDGHVEETIFYIAWEPSAGEIDGMKFEVANTRNENSSAPNYIPFNDPFSYAPFYIADMQTFFGKDTANIRLQAKDANGVTTLIDEEQSRDSETKHCNEVVGYIAIGN